ncbi:MAG: hypothetical protein ACREEW_03975 [Caulobacteraceae bacterium]
MRFERAPGEEAHIWWGPIRSAAQAREIVVWTAAPLALVGLAPLGALALAGAHGDLALAFPFWTDAGDNWALIGQLALIAVELFAALALLATRAAWSGVLLFACGLAAAAAPLPSLLGGHADPLTAVRDAGLEFCLVLLMRLVWRATKATRALRLFEATEAFA